MRWNMSFCACLVSLLHDSSCGFGTSTAGGNHAVIWTATCYDLVHLGLGPLLGHEQVRHFDFGCPGNASCAVDCGIVTVIV